MCIPTLFTYVNYYQYGYLFTKFNRHWYNKILLANIVNSILTIINDLRIIIYIIDIWFFHISQTRWDKNVSQQYEYIMYDIDFLIYVCFNYSKGTSIFVI